MTATRTVFIAALATITWGCVFGLQRPPPRYSQQYMPQTSFTCRNKIVGSYYADPETDCQLFHVCVSVAGSVQDYRFLCPNDTAFDQESQTCADWYDVDCEAATLYYASDNFDLYRLGSGLESLHYDSIRSDFEPQDHLQRSESNDPIRSPLNAYSSNSYKEPEAQKKNSQFAVRNQKQITPDFDKEKLAEPEKKNLRKVHRKPVGQGFTNAYTTSRLTQSTTTAPPVQPTQAPRFTYSTASPRVSSPTVSYTTKTNLSPSTLRPTTKYAATTSRSTANSQDSYSSNYQTTTVRSSSFNNNLANAISTNYPEPQTYTGQYTQVPSSTTKQPTGNYQQYNQANNNNNNYKNNNNYNNNYNYNSVQRTNNTTTYPTTTPASNNYDNSYNNYNNNKNNNNNYNNNYNNNNNNYNKNNNNYNNNNNNYNNNNNNYNANYETRPNTKKADYNQNTFIANTYAPTTYNPVTKKFNNNRQYFDKSTTLTTKSAQYTESDSTKAAKKVAQYKNYQNYETTTRSYDFGRSSIGLGFSPSSVNHLAENVRPTTPTPRRAAAPTTYNPNSLNVNTQTTQSQTPQQKSSYYQNQSTKQHSTTSTYFEESTTRKAAKKNDYDYAYYDNGPLEYDNLELEHITSNKESVKIT